MGFLSMLGPLGSIFGQKMANDSNAKIASKNRDFEHDEATRQLDFQREMSTTEYQRAVADMRAAGLNPILAAKGGNSSPSGASGSGSSAHMENVLSDAKDAFPMFLAQKKLDADIKLTNAQTLTEESKRNLNIANAGGGVNAFGIRAPFQSIRAHLTNIGRHVRTAPMRSMVMNAQDSHKQSALRLRPRPISQQAQAA